MTPSWPPSSDAVRIYDYPLTQGQVYNLATLYNLNTPPQGTVTNPTSDPPAGSVAPGFTAPTSGEWTLGQTLFGFQPAFNAPFQTNPSSLVGGSTSYTWLQQDPLDAASGVQSVHQGLVTMNGGATSFIDLTQVTGSVSIGQTLPIVFGASSGTGTAYGWSIDLVFKPLSLQTWAKFFDLGSGAYIDSLYLGWVNNNNVWEIGNYETVSNGLATARAGGTATGGSSLGAFTNVLSAPVLGSWYHVAWVMTPQSTDATFASATASVAANWTVYVNGVVAVQNFAGLAPLPIFRHASYIGRSDWFQEGTADPNINATFDAFRVWDRALSTSQVQSLARTYGLYSNASSATSVSAGGDFQLQSALGANARLPVFNANFSVNPAAQVGGTINYKWQTVDTTDTSANQGLHQGLLILDGVTGYVNLSQSTGPWSCGLLVPAIGGTSFNTVTPGWSFEFVWKPTGESTTWAKLLDLGNGPANGFVTPGADDWTIGFDGQDLTQFLVETYNSGTPQYPHAYTQMQPLTLGVWYHMVVVQTQVGTAGAANWFVYVNGAMQNWSYPLNSQAPVTTVPVQGANYPPGGDARPVVHRQVQLG